MSTENTSANLSEEERRRINVAAQDVVNVRIVTELKRLIGQWKDEEHFRRRALVLLLPFAGVLLVLLVFLIAGLARSNKPTHTPVIALMAPTSPLLAGYQEAWRAKAEMALAGACPSHGAMIPLSAYASTYILNDGRIEKVEIRRGSGVAAFDKALIVALASIAPLQPFSPEMRATMDVLVIAGTITISPEWCKSR